MSVNVTGTARLPNSDEIVVHGRPGKYAMVSVQITALVNRDTDSKRIKKYLKLGWDWNKYSPITVARFPNGEMSLLDGDHRKHMYVLTFPAKPLIPAYIIDVGSEEEYHKLFYEVNWANRKNATKEEVFVHQVLANEKPAIATVSDLTACNVSVYGSSDPHGVVGASNSPHVTVGAFRRAMKHGINNVKLSVNLMRSTWGMDKKLQGELLEGIALIYSLYPALQKATVVSTDFNNWFATYVGIHTQHNAASDYKTKGGRVHHRHAQSIARGLVREYRRTQLPTGCSIKWKQKKIGLKRLNDLVDG